MSLRSMLATAGAVAAVMLSGCGGQPAASAATPQDLLRQATQSTAQLRSASLDMRMSAASGADSQVGFAMTGSFAAAQSGQLPLAHSDLTQFVGSEKHSSGFVSTGSDAFLINDGVAYNLPADQVASLRQAGDGSTLTSGVHLDQWLQAPTTGPSSQLDGANVDTLQGSVNVAAFFNDLVQLTQGPAAGAPVPQIAPGSEADLAKVVKSSRMEISAGQADHVVRRLHLEVNFSAVLPPSLQGSLKNYTGAQLTFDMTVSHINEAVTVTAPPSPHPFAELVQLRCRQDPSQPGC